jgi:hypothetical protein
MADMKIYQEVELSLTENLIPTAVHVKQFDHKARKIRCRLYTNSVEYTIPADAIISCAGTRPDGHLFQYSSETAPELITVEDNAVIFTITEFMTEVSGRFPVDVILLDNDGDVLGTFCLTLRVERSAVGNGRIATITYAKAVGAIAGGIRECFTTEDGYFGFLSDDGLGFETGSVSSTIDKLHETINNCSINDGGYLVFDTDDGLGLAFGTDADGRLVVQFHEEI